MRQFWIDYGNLIVHNVCFFYKRYAIVFGFIVVFALIYAIIEIIKHFREEK